MRGLHPDCREHGCNYALQGYGKCPNGACVEAAHGDDPPVYGGMGAAMAAAHLRATRFIRSYDGATAAEDHAIASRARGAAFYAYVTGSDTR